MRHTCMIFTAVAAVMATAACDNDKAGKAADPAAAASAAPTGAAEMPKLKAGLWRLTMADGPPADTRMCIDDAVQEKMSVIGGQTTMGTCSENRVTPRPGGGYDFHSVCSAAVAGGGTTTSRGQVTGDFQSRYTTQVTVTTEGASVPAMNGVHTVQTEATYVGPCPDGMRPGDMEMAGGMRMNVVEMAEAAARMGAQSGGAQSGQPAAK